MQESGHRSADAVAQDQGSAANLSSAHAADDRAIYGVIDAAKQNARAGGGFQAAGGDAAAVDLERAGTGPDDIVISQGCVDAADSGTDAADAIARSRFVQNAEIDDGRGSAAIEDAGIMDEGEGDAGFVADPRAAAHANVAA